MLGEGARIAIIIDDLRRFWWRETRILILVWVKIDHYTTPNDDTKLTN